MRRRKPHEQGPPSVAWCERNFSAEVEARVFHAAEFKCQRCGVEMGRSVLRHLTKWDDPRAWMEFSGTAPRTWDDHIVVVRLVVWAPEWPWTGPETALEARCMGC